MIFLIGIIALIIVGIYAGVTAYKKFLELKLKVQKEMEENPQLLVKYYLDTYTVKEFPCTLIVANIYNSKDTFLAYDFSKYEENNIIMLTHYKAEEKDEEEEVVISAPMPNQKICLMEDGTYLWDTR